MFQRRKNVPYDAYDLLRLGTNNREVTKLDQNQIWRLFRQGQSRRGNALFLLADFLSRQNSLRVQDSRRRCLKNRGLYLREGIYADLIRGSVKEKVYDRKNRLIDTYHFQFSDSFAAYSSLREGFMCLLKPWSKPHL